MPPGPHFLARTPAAQAQDEPEPAEEEPAEEEEGEEEGGGAGSLPCPSRARVLYAHKADLT